MLTLYQFAISHFCEKARWALAYKKLEYVQKNLLPGPHLAQTKRLGIDTSATPILIHDGNLIQGSGEIISHLDQHYPQRPLTPDSPELRAQCAEWETYLDQEVGVQVRRYCYHYLLQHPAMVIPLYTQGGPWYGALIYKLIFPKLRSKMRHYMKINESTAQESKQRFEAAIERINAHLQQHSFLVGEQFTRADLTAAALFAPIVQPPQFGLKWPAKWPDEMNAEVQKILPKLHWVSKIYDQYR
jgi:glutathione S-transferase